MAYFANGSEGMMYEDGTVIESAPTIPGELGRNDFTAPIMPRQMVEGEEIEGGLDLRLRRFILKGGESGPAEREESAEREILDGKEVMQLIEGDTLENRLVEGRPLPPKEVARIGMQMAAGLAAAHGRGMVHRDIKPANILIEAETDRVKLTDFGLARATDDIRLTKTGMAMAMVNENQKRENKVSLKCLTSVF